MGVEKVGMYKPGRGRDMGRERDVSGGRDTGGGRDASRGRDTGGGRDVGRGSDLGRGSDAGGSALKAPHSSAAACARVLAAAEHASGFARLPDCSPAPYGSSLAARLRFGSLMCWAVSTLSTLPLGHLFTCFTPICVAVSGQER